MLAAFAGGCLPPLAGALFEVKPCIYFNCHELLMKLDEGRNFCSEKKAFSGIRNNKIRFPSLSLCQKAVPTSHFSAIR
jgi:hypothetical protein